MSREVPPSLGKPDSEKPDTGSGGQHLEAPKPGRAAGETQQGWLSFSPTLCSLFMGEGLGDRGRALVQG